MYAGTKQATGSPVERAGLTNGVRKTVAVAGFPTESGAAAFPDTPQPFTLADPDAFDLPEDGAWDPTNPNDYYFATTASMTKQGRVEAQLHRRRQARARRHHHQGARGAGR